MAPLSNTLDCVSFDDHTSGVLSNTKAKSALTPPRTMTLRKTVSFAVTVNIRTTIHLNEYSSQEKQDTWYNREEVVAMRRNATVDANCPKADTCLRGLEAKTATGARKKKQKRIEARAAVFLEQEIQDEDGLSDPDAIADAYFECSEACQAEAQMLALRDEKEAMEAHGVLKISDIKLPTASIILVEMVFAGSAAA